MKPGKMLRAAMRLGAALVSLSLSALTTASSMLTVRA
jgi:hypothetical protein